MLSNIDNYQMYIHVLKKTYDFLRFAYVFFFTPQFVKNCKIYDFFSNYNYHKNSRIIEKDQSKVISENVYVGPSYSNDEIKTFLDSNKISFEKLETKDMLIKTAKLISEGNIVGWYQG